MIIRLEMKNYNAILTEEQQIYQLHNQAELVNVNILQMKKYYLLIKLEKYNKLSSLFLLQEKLLKNKQKQLKIKEENK